MEKKQAKRVFARQVAVKLTAEELKQVSGGNPAGATGVDRTDGANRPAENLN